MKPVSVETIQAAIAIIGTSGIEDQEIEQDVRALVTDDITARWLIDWIPEAFGIVLVSHISNEIILPRTFSAKSNAGKWVELSLEIEPVFVTALQIAQTMIHDGPKEVFRNVSLRSSITNAANNALNSGASLEGASISGPALIGISADVYLSLPKSWWKKVFGA